MSPFDKQHFSQIEETQFLVGLEDKRGRLKDFAFCRFCGQQDDDHDSGCILNLQERQNDRFTDRMAIILRQPIELEVA